MAGEPPRSYPGLESNAALVNPFEGVVQRPQAQEYQGVRPTYPPGVYDTVLEAPGPLTVVDIGAGTGQFTRGLMERGVTTVALDPSESMRAVLAEQPWADGVEIGAGTGEETGLEDNCADVVVWAQCSHWLNIPEAAQEAARILRPFGVLAVVANQLDVEVPWVHRLSRIMRSGDVVRANRPPPLGESFTELTLHQFPWVQELSVEEVLALARTRSSYLQATSPRRERMQENLVWYLTDHMGFAPEMPVHLPYTAFVWTAGLAGANDEVR